MEDAATLVALVGAGGATVGGLLTAGGTWLAQRGALQREEKRRWDTVRPDAYIELLRGAQEVDAELATSILDPHDADPNVSRRFNDAQAIVNIFGSREVKGQAGKLSLAALQALVWRGLIPPENLVDADQRLALLMPPAPELKLVRDGIEALTESIRVELNVDA